MDDKKFKEMDRSLMKKTESLREQKVSEGMLKGFSASVERRIASGAETAPPKRAGRLVWVPAFAVMVLASVAVLRAPVQELQLAQAVSSTDEVQDDIAVLTELGVLDEYEDAELLVEDDLLADENMELTKTVTSYTAVA